MSNLFIQIIETNKLVIKYNSTESFKKGKKI